MNIGQWLLLEERLRKARDIETLQIIIVNLLQHVFPYQQAVLFEKSQSRYKARSASNISEIDPQAKAVVWLEKKFLPWLGQNITPPAFVPLNDIPFPVDDHYRSTAGCLYLTIQSPKIGHWGLICWLNVEPAKQLLDFAPLMSSTFSHAWEKLHNERKAHSVKPLQKDKLLIASGVGFFVIFCLFFIKVTQSTLATAEISPEHPLLIAPSINGAIKTIDVEPNETVKPGTILFQLDDISIRNKLEEATQALNVANQKYLKAYRHAYSATESREELKVLKEEMEQARVMYEYQKSLLERTIITAPTDGVALYSDPKDWLGKPVNIGEKVMLLANPNDKEITFWIPIDNMIELDLKHNVRFFPNENPTSTFYANLEYVNPIAEQRPDGTLAYFGVAKFKEEDSLRLGEKGTLKLYGDKVSIAHYLFRRPLRYVRQTLGI